MSKPLDLIDYLQAGWTEGQQGLSTDRRADQFAAYYSSDCWLAFEAGGLIRYMGLPKPVRCRKSRGYSIRFVCPHDRERVAIFDADNLAVSRIEFL